MPQDKCRRADGDISDDSALALGDGIVGDKDSAEECLFEQRWGNKEAERQHNRHWIINDAHREQPYAKTDDQRCAEINRYGYQALERRPKRRNSEPLQQIVFKIR